MSKISKTIWKWECDICESIAETSYNSSPPKGWFDMNGRWNIFKIFCSKDCLEKFLNNEFIERNIAIFEKYEEEVLNNPPIKT